MDKLETVWEKWMKAKEWWGYEIALSVLVDAYQEEFINLFNDVMMMNCMRCRSFHMRIDGKKDILITL